MFGPYEINYNGQRYFANVSLVEYHIFKTPNAAYLFNVTSHTASAVPVQLAATCAKVDSSFGYLISETTMAELRKFNLVAEEGLPQLAADVEEGCSNEEDDYPVVNLVLFLAQECNMRCIYCYGDGGKYAGNGMLSEETAFRAVNWLMVNSKTAEKVTIAFFGGEPLLNFPLLKRIVPYAKDQAMRRGKRVYFSISTNGSLLNDEIITFLREEDIGVFISFDGPPEYQNRQRPFTNGAGSYDKVFENIQKLRTSIPRFAARATLWHDADPRRIMATMEQAGFATYSIVKASPVLLPSQLPFTCTKPEEVSGRMLAYYHEAAERLLAAIRQRRIDRVSLPDLLLPLAEIDRGRRRHYGCGVGKGMVGISASGDIYPCHRFVGLKELCLGNITNCSIDGLNDYWRASVDFLPKCRGCWARHLCGGGCFYHNKALTGNMYQPDEFYCCETKAMFEELIYVLCELDENDKEFLRSFKKRTSEEGAMKSVGARLASGDCIRSSL